MIQGFQIYFALKPRLKGMEGLCWAAQPIRPESGLIGCAAQHGPSMPFNLGFHVKYIWNR